jgi:thiol:disulfide interchange protein
MNVSLRWLGCVALLAVVVGCNESNPPGGDTDNSLFPKLSFAEAQQQAKADGKLVMVDFYTDWCGYCEKLDATTWKDGKVRQWLREHVVAVKIDAERQEKLAAKYEVDSYPTILFLKPDGSEVHRVDGYVTAKEFLAEVAALDPKKAR